jgi:hypothetical protein
LDGPHSPALGKHAINDGPSINDLPESIKVIKQAWEIVNGEANTSHYACSGIDMFIAHRYKVWENVGVVMRRISPFPLVTLRQTHTINARHHSAVERCAEDVSHLVQWRQMRMVCQSKEGPVPLDQKFTEGILVLWQLESAMKS